MKVCVVGASGKLGRYMVQHALDRGHEVVGVCREESVGKLDAFKGRMTIVPGATDDTEVIKRAVAGCDGVLVVLVPRGVHGYSTGTAQAVLDHVVPYVNERTAFGEPVSHRQAVAFAVADMATELQGMRIGLDGVQLLGGHGFVKEHPVERWYRDLRAVAILEGGVLVP